MARGGGTVVLGDFFDLKEDLLSGDFRYSPFLPEHSERTSANKSG